MTSQFISFQQHGHIFFVEFLPEDSPETYKITMWNDSLLEKWRNKLQKYIRPYLQQIFHGNTDYLGYNE